MRCISIPTTQKKHTKRYTEWTEWVPIYIFILISIKKSRSCIRTYVFCYLQFPWSKKHTNPNTCVSYRYREEEGIQQQERKKNYAEHFVYAIECMGYTIFALLLYKWDYNSLSLRSDVVGAMYLHYCCIQLCANMLQSLISVNNKKT